MGEAQLAVLTNGPLGPTRKILEGLDVMDKFRWVIGGDGPFPRKPDPAGLQHLMTQAQASPARSVMVGDSGADLATARAAGTKVCLARYGFGYRIPPANLLGDEIVADSPAEILVSNTALAAGLDDVLLAATCTSRCLVPINAAALGTDLVLTTLDGEEKLDIRAGTQSGTVIHLARGGVPRLKSSHAR